MWTVFVYPSMFLCCLCTWSATSLITTLNFILMLLILFKLRITRNPLAQLEWEYKKNANPDIAPAWRTVTGLWGVLLFRCCSDCAGQGLRKSRRDRGLRSGAADFRRGLGWKIDHKAHWPWHLAEGHRGQIESGARARWTSWKANQSSLEIRMRQLHRDFRYILRTCFVDR